MKKIELSLEEYETLQENVEKVYDELLEITKGIQKIERTCFEYRRGEIDAKTALGTICGILGVRDV